MSKTKTWAGFEKYADIVYPNSSLVEVIAETRFPVALSVECKRDCFYEKIKKDFPIITFPLIQNNSIIAYQPYQFSSIDGSEWILLAVNKFSYHTRKYSGHKKFGNKYLKLADLFSKVFSVAKFDRIGWRYINLIPFVRESGVIPISRFFNMHLKLPETIPDDYQYLSATFVVNAGSGSIVARLTPFIKDDGMEAFFLDIDYGVMGNLTFENMKTNLEEAHRYTRGCFESLITDNYRQFLRGDTL